jgi:YD repeat-containing protein
MGGHGSASSGSTASAGSTGAPSSKAGAGTQAQAKPSSESNSEEDCASSSGNPVLLTTGEKFLDETDFASSGYYALNLTRTYRSQQSGSVLFGNKWRSTADAMRITWSGQVCEPGGPCAPREAVLTETDGTRYKYTLPPGYVGEYTVQGSNKMGWLYFNFINSGWELRRDDRIYTFKSNGLLWTQKNLAFKTLYTYGWTGSSMTSLTNAAGATITFGWSGGRVVTATDPSGQVWTYGYNANDMLSQVASPGSPANVRTYHYEHPGDSTLLTGVSINGVRHTRYSYHSDKRVHQSGPEDGEDKDTIQYGNNSATISSPKRPATTYAFTPVKGELRTTAISRAGGTSCPSAAAQTVYDSNGHVDYMDDWNGHRTDFSYDGNGRLMARTLAAGSASASTAAHTWSGSRIMKTDFKDANGTTYLDVTYTYHTGLANGELASETWRDLGTGAQRQILYAFTFHAGGALIKTYQVAQTLGAGTQAVHTTEYDTQGFRIKETNALGHVTQWSLHDGMGRPGRMTDANGVVTNHSYHANGNLISATAVLPMGNRTTTFAHNGNRQLTDISYPTGHVDRLRYNGSGRLVQTGNAQAQYVTRSFDPASRLETVQSARHVPSLSGSTPVALAGGNYSTTTLRDCEDKPCAVYGNHGQQITFGYDGMGNVVSRTDAAGRVTLHTYDARNRLTQTTAPDGGVTHYRYNPQGQS